MRETNNEGLYQFVKDFLARRRAFAVKPDASLMHHGAWVTVHNGQVSKLKSRISRHEGREAGGQAGRNGKSELRIDEFYISVI